MLTAKLKDLKSKYYGTIVEVTNELGNHVFETKFWLTFSEVGSNKSYDPSDRELSKVGLTRDDWDNNATVIDELGNKTTVHKLYNDLACDHFEDQYSYEIAQMFTDAFNKTQGK